MNRRDADVRIAVRNAYEQAPKWTDNHQARMADTRSSIFCWLTGAATFANDADLGAMFRAAADELDRLDVEEFLRRVDEDEQAWFRHERAQNPRLTPAQAQAAIDAVHPLHLVGGCS